MDAISTSDSARKKGLGVGSLWFIGVGMVISGNYFGWNFSVLEAGFVGMVTAVVFMAALFISLALCVAELASAIPLAGGLFAYTRCALGKLCGFLAGFGSLIEYGICAPVVCTGVGGYINFLWPSIPPFAAGVAIYVLLICIQLMGIDGFAKFETAVTAIAIALLIILYVFGLPNIDPGNLLPSDGATVPGGVVGIWSSLPYAMWLFIGIEMLGTMAEDCREPSKDLPRSIMLTAGTLFILACLTTTTVLGLGGTELVNSSLYPLPDAVAHAMGQGHWLASTLALLGLFGLIASFSAVILACSKPAYTLARAGYLPKVLSKTNKHGAPYWALILPAVVGIVLVYFLDADQLQLIATFGALVSYILACTSLIVLRKTAPDMPRPFKAPLFPVLPIVAIVLSIVAIFSSVFKDPVFFLVDIAVFAVAAVYYLVWASKHVDENAPEERFAATFKPQVQGEVIEDSGKDSETVPAVD